MSFMRGSMQRRPFAWFLFVTFSISWTAWFLQYMRPNPMDGLGIVLFFVGGIGPFVGAIVVAGWTGIREFRARLFRFRVRPSRYLGALVVPVLMAFGFLVVLAGLEGGELPFELLAPIGAYPGMLLSGIIFGGLEEPGWRGFAQAHLQDRFSWLIASLIVGAAWVLWHIPLFLIPGTAQASLPITSFAMMGIGLSIVFGWAFNWTNLSVPVMILLHGGFNAAQGWSGIIVPGMIDSAMFAMVITVWSMVLLIFLASRSARIVSMRSKTPDNID